MRVTYVTHTRFPTEKAHGHQIAQVCDALARLGHEVTLVAPTVTKNIPDEPHEYYGLKPSFKIVHLPNFDALNSKFVPGALSFEVSMWSYRRHLRHFLRDHQCDVLYARSPVLLRPLIRSGHRVILELHTLPRIAGRFFTRLCNHCDRVVCLTTPMRDDLMRRGVDPARCVVESDGVDIERYAALPSLAEAKKKWSLPTDRPIAGYVGSLVARNTLEKGVDVFIRALARLNTDGHPVFGWIVGGPEDWQARYQVLARELGLGANDIRFHPRVSATDVPAAIAASDLCVYPAPATEHAFFLRDTSPLKLFEYLAAGKPVVCADIPPLRDVVDADSVELCRPGNPRSLADAIIRVTVHPSEALRRAETGREIARRHSWTARMQRILALRP